MPHNPTAAHFRSAPEKKAERDPDRNRRDWEDIRALLIKLAVMVLAAFIFLGVIFGVAVQEGEDMYPRIRDGDLMVFYRLSRDYQIGDVVTFQQDGRRYTARIVAQGGDEVNVDEEGQLKVNGSVQEEEIFYPTQAVDGGIELPCKVPDGSVFLLCDFRTQGLDSRVYGPVKIAELDGKVISILRRRGI